jgi:hypothetical protein
MRTGILRSIFAVAAVALVGPLSVHAQIMPVAPQDPALRYHVDASWPRAFPGKMAVGDVSGVTMDRHDHIWVIHRPGTLSKFDTLASATPPTAKCCIAAPPVLEFDGAGNLLRQWGGAAQSADWPDIEHGIFVDAQDHVWVLGSGARDGVLLKFTADGKQLLRIGRKGDFAPADDPTMLGKPTDLYVDTQRHEVFVSDGYRNRRVIVFDSETGAFKRQWTAFGKPVDGAYIGARSDYSAPPPPRDYSRFTTVHCVTMIGGEVYVCDRGNDRIQVFTPEGKYLREIFLNRGMAGPIGSTWDAAPVPGRPELLAVIDGINSEIAFLDRLTGALVGSYAAKGRFAGQMHWPHQMAMDREGRIYVAEVDNAQRIQRFVPDRKIAQ